MRWVDPSIKLLAAAISNWRAEFVERIQLLLDHAPDLIDYLAIHWYVGNEENDFVKYMAISEFIEERISVAEGLIRAMKLQRNIQRPIAIAVDEWNVWYRARGETLERNNLAEIYNLKCLVVAAFHFYPPCTDGENGKHRPDCQCDRPDLHQPRRFVSPDNLPPIRGLQPNMWQHRPRYLLGR
jgi:alpha-L-arabinofuranosidase